MNKKNINNLIVSEHKLHPKAELVDYYKLFFQGTFGPEHIIRETGSALDFLKNELAQNETYGPELYQNISFLNNFFRVNLKIVKDGSIALSDYFEGFLRSRELTKQISWNEWLNEWKKIKEIIYAKKIIPDFSLQEKFLQIKIEQQEPVSHSNSYKIKYHPHYRLFSEKEFLKLNLKSPKK